MRKDFNRTDWITIEITRKKKNETLWTELDYFDDVTKSNLDDVILQYLAYVTQAKNNVTEEKFDNAYKVLKKRIFEAYESMKNTVNTDHPQAWERVVCTTMGYDRNKCNPCVYRLTLFIDNI